jgi:membrane protein YdbS with pleckstrin-like domain
MNNPGWMQKLKVRWKLKSAMQVLVVLVVFACTGFTVFFIKRPLLVWMAGSNGDTAVASLLYYIFILPLYNIILLGYGILFGQFSFFWNFEKRFMERFFTWLKKRK